MYKLKPKRDGLQRSSTKLYWKQEGTQQGWFTAFISLWTKPSPCTHLVSNLSCPPLPHHFALLPPSFHHRHHSLPLGSYLAPLSRPSCLYPSLLLSFLSVHACKLKKKKREHWKIASQCFHGMNCTGAEVQHPLALQAYKGSSELIAATHPIIWAVLTSSIGNQVKFQQKNAEKDAGVHIYRQHLRLSLDKHNRGVIADETFPILISCEIMLSQSC